jgi:hypothetical protein
MSTASKPQASPPLAGDRCRLALAIPKGRWGRFCFRWGA